jgi:hypothetical protein
MYSSNGLSASKKKENSSIWLQNGLVGYDSREKEEY